MRFASQVVTKIERPGAGRRFIGERYCGHRQRQVSYEACLRCFNGFAEKRPPGGFNHVGCQDAHLRPSPVCGARYGSVDEKEKE